MQLLGHNVFMVAKEKVRHRVGAFIIRDKKLLLVSGQGIPVFWSPGGTLEEGESLEDALRREIMEELGVEVTEHSFYDHITIEAADYGATHFIKSENDYFLVEVEGEPEPLAEISILKWFSRDDLDEPLLQPAYRNVLLPRLIQEELL